MPTARAAVAQSESTVGTGLGALRAKAVRAARVPFVRELLIVFAFCVLTAVMTWPWATRLRDAVGDAGDPYMIAYTLWWDYHQTFHDPLNLFHASVFYPYQYTLAFSEHDYGIALPFFPLFALGFRPLTVHSVATFMGFVFSGYGAFRLTRTLTGSRGAAWVAGVFFAFVPYRFSLISHLHYLFAGWIPLLLEALVLFARERSRRRAAWLAAAFVMNALTCITWFILTLVPLALTLGYLVARYRLVRERRFWLRGAAAMAAACVLLLPFMLPYQRVSALYGFVWSRLDAIGNSPPLASWLMGEQRNKLWRDLGQHLGGTAPLFPGLLPLLLSLAALLFVKTRDEGKDDAAAAQASSDGRMMRGALFVLDALSVVAGALALVAAGYVGAPGPKGEATTAGLLADRALFVLVVSFVARCCIAYPRWLRRGSKNLLETLRAPSRGDAFWLGLVWAVVGFLMSLGMNSFVYRFIYDHIFLFRSQRIPARGAMLAYVGLALLAGVGAASLARAVQQHLPRVRPAHVFVVLACALLFELRAAPLQFVRGAVYPDEVTLRLKETPMRGGIVHLPMREDGFDHRATLRAADHERPLVTAHASFFPPIPLEIEQLTHGGPVPDRLLELLEEIPASYLVVHTKNVAPERRADYEAFLVRGLKSGRLRYVRRFDEANDLYAVAKNEPDARTEAPPPFAMETRTWRELLEADPLHVLGPHQEWSQRVYRLHLATDGRLPRYENVLTDLKVIGEGAVVGDKGETARLSLNLRRFADTWVERPDFKSLHGEETDARYIDALFRNAGVTPDASERATLVDALSKGMETRASVLLKIVDHERFVRQERSRSVVVLHFFGYLRRNPGEPPDANLDGMLHWLKFLESTGDTAHLALAFRQSLEHKRFTGEP